MLQADAINCGVHHLYHLGGCNYQDKILANNVMYDLLKSVYDKPMGLCCFNDNVDAHDNSNGRILAKVIEDSKLGMIIAGPVALNPIHKNETHIQAWSWAVDKVALLAWLEKNKPQSIREQEAREEWLNKEAKAKMAAKNKPLTTAQVALVEFDPLPSPYIWESPYQ